MAGRRFIDAAKLFNASKAVAKQHVKLRSEQLDVYSKTSSLARAVKDQTDRVTLTAQAAIVLSQRLNENRPSYAPFSNARGTAGRSEATARKETVEGERLWANNGEGKQSDQSDKRSNIGTDGSPSPEDELDIRQEDAERRPLPDGSIPSAGVTLENEGRGEDTSSKRSVPEPSKQPLAEQHHKSNQRDDEGLKPTASRASTIPTPPPSNKLSPEAARKLQRYSEGQIPSYTNVPQQPRGSSDVQKLQEGHDRDVFYARSVESAPEYSSLPRSKIPKFTENKQGSDDNVRDEHLNQDVYYSTPEPKHERPELKDVSNGVAVSDNDQLPEGIDTDVFRSQRVAKMLGGTPYKPKPSANSKGVSSTPDDHTETSTGHDQDTTNVGQRNQATAAQLHTGATSTSATTEKEMRDFASQLADDANVLASPNVESANEMNATSERAPYELRESRVPSSRIGRLWQYAGLGTSMAFGAVSETLRRAAGGAASAGGSIMLSPGNMEILVSKLSRMRGAALKLGQMISIQDIKMLPPEIHQVLQRVQDSADYMPASQRNKVLTSNLGADWRDLFESFDDVPIAAASIGQVHKAVLRSTGQSVAVKVQYPGVANSIDSDLNNLSILLTASRLLPKGLYLDKTIANARTELGWECDYIREAECQMRFRDLLKDDTDVFTVPKVISEASGREVLTAELMAGVGVTKLPQLTQSERDWIGTQILRLSLREIVEFKFMQTDPNWTNFLYNKSQQKIELLDFGASREYPDEFVDPYVQILIGASQGNKTVIRDGSIQLGYLTGAESKAMLEAHVQSVLTLAEPFQAHGPAIYDFKDQTITDRVRSLIPIMVRERLAPPPEETYSLHRKLSGAFLLCARLGSRVPCRELFEKAIQTHEKGGKVL